MNCKRCGGLINVNDNNCPHCGLEKPKIDWQLNKNSFNSRENTAKQNSNSSYSESVKSQEKTNYTTTTNKNTQSQQNYSTANSATKQTNKSSFLKKAITFAIIIAIIAIIVNLLNGGRLKGTWIADDDSFSITFSDKKEGYIENHGTVLSSSDRVINFTYETDGKELTLKTKETLYSSDDVERFEYEIKGDKLTLKEISSGTEITFHKK